MTKIVQPNIFDGKITASECKEDLTAFLTIYNNNLHIDTSSLMTFVRSFFSQYPMMTHSVFNLYLQAMNTLGRRDLANELACLAVELSEEIAFQGKKIVDGPLCFRDYAFLHRIGEIVDQTAYLASIQKLGVLKHKPLLAITEKTLLANNALLPYLADWLEIVTDPKEVFYFSQIRKFRPISTFLYKFSDTQYGHSGDFFYDCHLDMIAADIDKPIFKLKDETIGKALNYLKKWGFHEDDEFVVLHLREGISGRIYSQHKSRNADINKFRKSIEYLLAMGLKVIRIGHKSMTPIFERSGFIDLTAVEKPAEVDIFLCGAAKFYFGSASGPYSLASQFGTKCCVAKYEAYQGNRPNDFTQFLPFKNSSTKKSLNFTEIEESNLQGIFATAALEKHGVSVGTVSSRENLELVCEMLEYLDKGSIFKKNQHCEASKQKHKIWGGLPSQTIELFNL